jgi:regulator of protease activity HflC (stomatin/prohibitin superfamily)
MIVETSTEPKLSPAASRPSNREIVADAYDTVKEKSPKIFLFIGIIALIIVYLAPSMFITIQSGQVGVLYLRFFGGTQTDRVLSEGFKVIPPWDKLFIYTVRVQEAKHDLTVLTHEGMNVLLHVSIRYHPEADLVGLLHQRVGPDYKDRVVIPEVEAALRTTMANFSMRDAYGSQRGLVQRAINDSLEQVSQKFVKVDNIVLRGLELPAKVRESIEEKMTQQELSEAYKFRIEREQQEALRKKIEADGTKLYNDTLNSSITPNVLKWRGIEATRELAQSPNTKTVIVGTSGTTLPLMLGSEK